MAAMAVGTTMGWTSAAEQPLTNTTLPGDLKVDKSDFSWVSAMLSIGAILGAVPLGYLANIIGRKKVLILLAPVMSVGYILLAFSNSVSNAGLISSFLFQLRYFNYFFTYLFQFSFGCCCLEDFYWVV